MAIKSEYEVESLFIEQMERLGYEFIKLKDYSGVLVNLKFQLERFNKEALEKAKGESFFSDTEFTNLMKKLENNDVFVSAGYLRDTHELELDNGNKIYVKLFGSDTTKNVYQITRQVTMSPDHKGDVLYKNRYDVTILVNGLPLVQIELKRSGIELNEAINQINRYRKYSFVGLFRYIQIFVVSNSEQTKYYANNNETDRNGNLNPILKSLTFYWTDEENQRINKLYDFSNDFFRKVKITDIINRYMILKKTEKTMIVMRPYQICATEAVKERVVNANRNGFVWHTTGSGKTLTSFKCATLLRDERYIDKVFFLIDRKDLDDQSVDEYNQFEPGCVDSTDSVESLVKQLQSSEKKLIVTTIQKLHMALRKKKYQSYMEPFRTKKCVFIIDECHRSQFGKMHGSIERHFQNANFIGFTGTPIFKKNKGNNKKITADVFKPGDGDECNMEACLHKYLIKEAIADGNVLKFLVEYHKTIEDGKNDYSSEKRLKKVAKHIIDNHDKHVQVLKDSYTSIFATENIATLSNYYEYLNKENNSGLRIAAIFSLQQSQGIDDGECEGAKEILKKCMDDYNNMFDTCFNPDTIDAYRKDIAKRLRQKITPQIDILLVVNMFLTGFDSRVLNTLYLDKSLIWHNLLQAYSRTNRVDKPTKQYGQIISYRDLKAEQDDALRLFSGDGDPNGFLLDHYDIYVKQFKYDANILRSITPTVDVAGDLQSEDDKRLYIVAFRRLAKTLSVLKTFSDFEWSNINPIMDEEEYTAYKSWYLTFYEEHKLENVNGLKEETTLSDIDFEIELIRTDKINVAYILRLLNVIKKENKAKRKESLDLLLRDLENSDNELLRLKRPIMKKFIETRFFDLAIEDDVDVEYQKFETETWIKEIEDFSKNYQVDSEIIKDLLSYKKFSGDVSKEQIRKKIEPMKLGIIKSSQLVKQIMVFVTETDAKYNGKEQDE